MRNKIKAARIAKGLTQAEMAQLLGYSSKSGYAMIESGRNHPPLSVALRIGAIVGLPVEQLFVEDAEAYEVKDKGGTEDVYY